MSDSTKLIEKLVNEHGNKREALLPILKSYVKEKRYLTEEALREIAKALDISGAEVYGTATFYSFLDLEPRGKNVIRVCKTIVCDMKGKNQILKAIKECLGINVGETTKDGLFSLLQTNCLGQCDKAPAMLINDEVYTDLTPDKVRAIIKEYKLNNKN